MAELVPARTITADQYNEAVRLYTAQGRVTFYTYLYDITGNDALLTVAKVASSSGVLVGGPAWTFNAILQSVEKNYPQGPAGIEQFSQDIGNAIKDSIR